MDETYVGLVIYQKDEDKSRFQEIFIHHQSEQFNMIMLDLSIW